MLLSSLLCSYFHFYFYFYLYFYYTFIYPHSHTPLFYILNSLTPISLTSFSPPYVRTCSVPQVNYTGPELSLSATEPLTQVPVELRDGTIVIYFAMSFNESWKCLLSFNVMCMFVFVYLYVCVLHVIKL